MTSSFMMNAQLPFYNVGRHRSPSVCGPPGRGPVSKFPMKKRCSNITPPSSHGHKATRVLVAQYTWNSGDDEATDASARHLADFHPSIWGDYFLNYASQDLTLVDDDKAVEQIQELKSEVKRMLVSEDYSRPAEKLNLINQIQRLGIAYHFDREIKDFLEDIYASIRRNGSTEDEDDLHTTALQFRLLRQHGIWISSSVFDKFKGREGNFDASLVNDVRGLLSLYEASHCSKQGEETLDEALSFCFTHLKSMEEKPLIVTHALKQCIHREMPRLEARQYIETYQSIDSHNEVLLSLAKLDFNLTQKLHQREVAEIARWWKDLDFKRELPFVRDRIAECYLWNLGVYFEPEYSLARKFVTKAMAMITAVDDIYDSYGTIEELELFTRAVERWDINAADELPGYMQVCYTALLDVYSGLGDTLAEEGRSYYLYYMKEAVKIMVRMYFQEAKWFNKQYIPTVEEYMEVAVVTLGYQMLIVASLLGMPEITTEDTFQWLLSNPNIVRASAAICRLMDDIASHKFEQERGHVASAVECCMKQYGVTEQEAENELKKQVEDAWKDINEGWLHLTEVPPHVLMRIVNYARAVDVMYKDGDCFTNSQTKLKDIIASLLVDPVPV
ncbi:(-)-germacrene D synthase-like [Punica granatum]|uniref:(-)-germacrene D synthase-like n=1 Tax=Punica granatum TaxID=22663 RepID=A0A6P8CZ34_PUNGR|nr:(-)-germacrene D synthase-like [Punica granatum]